MIECVEECEKRLCEKDLELWEAAYLYAAFHYQARSFINGPLQL